MTSSSATAPFTTAAARPAWWRTSRSRAIASRLGDLSNARGRQDVDASGLAVAPGFIDMLNHSETSLIADGRSQGMIRQGVTLSVFGEGSMGPLSDRMKADQKERQGDIKYDISWTTLGEYLDFLQRQGVSTNVVRSSARLPFGSTRSATTTGRRHRRSSSGCGRWSAARWTRARWA
jgi:N-acyl-D-aspartate/D-glutamate deacylase